MVDLFSGGKQLALKARGSVAFLRFVQDTERLPEVFRMAEGFATPQRLEAVVVSAQRTGQGAAAIARRVRLGVVDLSALERLPLGSLGRAFSTHMHANRLDAAAIETVPVPDGGDSDASYVRNHLRETHDIWHTILGFDTTIASELGVQAFYLAQIPTYLSIAILSGGLLNTLTGTSGLADVDVRMSAIARGWEMGKRAAPLFGIEWNTLWQRNLLDLRTELRIS